ncbi:MAG TPA: hypothetical protein VES88_03390 [Gemmatimonadaceae bacterium]|nr:hypothetical protein [Gemmatimonadaceae bacterium]
MIAFRPRQRLRWLAALSWIIGATACSPSESTPATDTAAMAAQSGSVPPTEAATPGGVLSVTAADLDGFEKGLARELELVRAANARNMNATTPEEGAAAREAMMPEKTIAEAASVTGLSPERYREVREKLHGILRTLDFQGKIDGPMSMDTTRASPEMRQMLASDAYAALDPAGAAALKARIDRIVPVWAEYVNLTAVAG